MGCKKSFKTILKIKSCTYWMVTIPR